MGGLVRRHGREMDGYNIMKKKGKPRSSSPVSLLIGFPVPHGTSMTHRPWSPLIGQIAPMCCYVNIVMALLLRVDGHTNGYFIQSSLLTRAVMMVILFRALPVMGQGL
jgi:hypothetical protein